MCLNVFLPPKESHKPYTISQINNGIASIIESENTLVWVEGEISNFKIASSGHCYFKLKDEQSQIPSVMWKSTFIKHKCKPTDGIAITAIASIRVYQRGGYYQLEIHKMQPSGIGELFAALEKLKKKLEKEGIFNSIHKKPLPETIHHLGVITSKTGAAIQDIIKVVKSRARQTEIIVRDTLVQGKDAPSEIIQAIRDMDQYGKVDCIILGRGGGSIEDLWAFNNENVVRAIFECNTPIISAIGHEIDFTLADFVADIRAPTPSAAAEIAVPDEEEKRHYYKEIRKRFSLAFQHYFVNIKREYKEKILHSNFRKVFRLISDSRQQRDFLYEKSIRAISTSLQKKRFELSKKVAQLEALNPMAILSRGYSVISKEDSIPIKNSIKIKEGDTIYIKFFSGNALADIIKVNNL